MSITFEPQRTGDVAAWRITRLTDEGDIVPFITGIPTYDDAQLAWIANDCDVWENGIEPDEAPRPSLNVANSNGAALLRALGLDFDGEFPCGTIDPTDLLDRLVLFNAVDDEGTDDFTYRGEGGATIIDCGRRPGQMNGYADRLREVAEAALADGVPVQWA